MAQWLIVSLACLALAGTAQAPQAAVVGRWHAVPKSAAVGRPVELVLRVEAAESAPEVSVQLVPTAGVEIVRGDQRWRGAFQKGQTRHLRYAVRVVAEGTWTLGASITNRRYDPPQVSGAVVYVVAKDGVAAFRADPPENR